MELWPEKCPKRIRPKRATSPLTSKSPNVLTKFLSNAAPRWVGIWIIGSKPRVNCDPPAGRRVDPSSARRRGARALRDSQRTIKCNRMPEKQTMERARRDRRQGKAASTQAGEFVREEMHHIREG